MFRLALDADSPLVGLRCLGHLGVRCASQLHSEDRCVVKLLLNVAAVHWVEEEVYPGLFLACMPRADDA